MTRALAALKARLSPPRRLRVTAEGRWFLLVTLGVGAAAINSGNNLLYLALGMNLALIVLSGLLSEWILRRVDVEVRGAGEAFAERDSFLAVSCAYPGRPLPLMGCAVAIPLESERVAVRFPDLPRGGASTRVVSFRPGRRGLVRLQGCLLSTRFPFGLFEKSAALTEGAPILVYPEPGSGEGATRPGAPGGGGEAPPVPARHGASIRGVRRLGPGDPIRDIHWKASAKRGTWLVKEREGEPAEAAEIRLPLSASPADFERAISRACALVLLWEREGRSYRLLHGDREVISPATPDRRAEALSFLALASPGPGRAGGDHPPVP